MVYPSLLLIYLGQGAYLVAHPETYSSLYFSALPAPVYWCGLRHIATFMTGTA